MNIRFYHISALILSLLLLLLQFVSCGSETVTKLLPSSEDPSTYSEQSSASTEEPYVPVSWCAHENTKKVSDKDATCVADGYKGRCKCKDCGLVLENTGTIIPAYGHHYEGRKCIYCEKNEPSIAIGGQFEGTQILWQLYDDGELSVSGNGEIPDFPEDTESYFFGYNKAVKSIVIYNGITRIGNNAFRNLKDPVTISISSSVREIGDHAFDGWCLKTLNLSYGIESIGKDNFTGNQIFFVDLPGSLRHVGAGSFSSAQTVTLRVPQSIVSYDAYEDEYYNFLNVAFVGTEEQASRLDLYKHLTEDGGHAGVKLHFKFTDKSSTLPYCTKRGQVSDNLKYSIFTGDTVKITGYNGSSSEVVVPEKIGSYTVVGIEHEAFKKNTVIKKITLPATLELIGYNAFIDSSIEEVTLLGSHVTVASAAFSGCGSFKTLNFDGVFDDVGGKAFAGTYVNNIKLSPEMKVARISAFASSQISNVDFSTIRVIADSAFARTSLGNIDLKGVEYIGYGAFSGAGVTFADVTDVKKIERKAFTSNSSLKRDKVVGLETVKELEKEAFDFKIG